MVASIEELKRLATAEPYQPVRPKPVPPVRTQADRDALRARVQRVIEEHRDVLMALKDR